MTNILIIGNSLSAVAAIEEIRRQDASVGITLFCAEGSLPYQRHLLPALVAKDLKETQLWAATDKFFQQHNVKAVTNEALVRISFKRKQVTTENKGHFAFDKLLLVDLPQVRLPEIKGNQKQGVFNALQLNDAKNLAKYVPFTDHIVVSVTNFAGLNMACALGRCGKDVSILSSTGGLLPQEFDDETGALLKQIVEGKGVRIVADGLESILGDTETKAVRLNSGKVVAAEMVVLDEVEPDLRPLSDSGLVENEMLPVNEFFQTKLNNVFACGAALGHFDMTPEEAIEQGRCAGANILHADSMPYRPPLSLRDFGTKLCEGFCGGLVRLQEGGREHMRFDGPQNIYKKIYLVDNCLVGAVWFNAAQDKDKVRQALLQKSSLAGIEDQFLQSNR